MLNNKIALVTGAGRGIGKAIALKLAEKGADIVINYRSSEESVREVSDMIQTLGRKSIKVKADIGDYNEAQNLINEAINSFGRIDILVNNAGITKDSLVLRMKEADFDDVINVNLKGTFNCIKHAVPFMVKQRSGKIINISSIVGMIGNAGQVNYSASKAGIIGITKSLSKELGCRGINVNAIAPGFIKTDMTEGLSEKLKEEMIEKISLKYFGSPEDVANVVSFLASEESKYITGQVIKVDGGMV